METLALLAINWHMWPAPSPANIVSFCMLCAKTKINKSKPGWRAVVLDGGGAWSDMMMADSESGSIGVLKASSWMSHVGACLGRCWSRRHICVLQCKQCCSSPLPLPLPLTLDPWTVVQTVTEYFASRPHVYEHVAVSPRTLIASQPMLARWAVWQQVRQHPSGMQY